MNKGLELIEAHYLFGVPYERITVVLDPQSTVHSMARFSDGAILAHLGVPDMRTPDRLGARVPGAAGAAAGAAGWTCSRRRSPSRAPDTETFRCLRSRREAGRRRCWPSARRRRPARDRGRSPARSS